MRLAAPHLLGVETLSGGQFIIELSMLQSRVIASSLVHMTLAGQPEVPTSLGE